MKVFELLKLCMNAVSNGNGDKTILLSDDDEGNGFHEMFYGFTTINDYFGFDSPDLDLYGFPEGTTDATHIILG